MNTKESGFTLIEVMIAIVVLSIGILGVSTMQLKSIGDDANNWKMSSVTNAATNVLEVLAGVPYDDDSMEENEYKPEQHEDGIDNNLNGIIDEDNEVGPLSVSWVISNNVLINNSKSITVSCTFQNNSRQIRTAITAIRAED